MLCSKIHSLLTENDTHEPEFQSNKALLKLPKWLATGQRTMEMAAGRTLQGLLSSNPGGATTSSLWPLKNPVNRRSRSITIKSCQLAIA